MPTLHLAGIHILVHESRRCDQSFAILLYLKKTPCMLLLSTQGKILAMTLIPKKLLPQRKITLQEKNLQLLLCSLSSSLIIHVILKERSIIVLFKDSQWYYPMLSFELKNRRYSYNICQHLWVQKWEIFLQNMSAHIHLYLLYWSCHVNFSIQQIIEGFLQNKIKLQRIRLKLIQKVRLNQWEEQLSSVSFSHGS